MADSLATAAGMRWWGWGVDEQAQTLGKDSLRYLRESVGVGPRPRPPVALAAVELVDSKLPKSTVDGLARILGSDGIRDDHQARVTHAAGKGYPDLVRLRAGQPQGAPDAVVYPSSTQQLAALLKYCEDESMAVVPFGGGTSVVGGLAPLAGEHRAVLALDMAGLAQIVELDRKSLMLRVQAGMRVADLERDLKARGLTLGHFPQSFEYVTVGGCAATRSAGQASSGYGRFEDMVLGLQMITPTGEPLDLAGYPASAAGPDLRQLVVGSEGTLGVISELELRVRQAPSEERYHALLFEDFQSGCEALRELAQQRLAPAVVRLSDVPETRMSMALAGGGRLKRTLGELYLKARGHGDGALAILGFAGSTEHIDSQRAKALQVAREHGALSLGERPGQAWAKQRFAAPYLRDELLTHGVMAETFETATNWSNLTHLHHRLAAASANALGHPQTPVMILCHVSHVYETGASLYFTVITRQREGEEIEQWLELKRAAGDAIKDSGATITHHHAIGHDHTEWMRSEVGRSGLHALSALKACLDPAGIMNPGKLLP